MTYLFKDLVGGGGGKVKREVLGFPYVESISTGGSVILRNEDGDSSTVQLATSHSSVNPPNLSWQYWGTAAPSGTVGWQTLQRDLSDLQGDLGANQVGFPYVKEMVSTGGYTYQDAAGDQQSGSMNIPLASNTSGAFVKSITAAGRVTQM